MKSFGLNQLREMFLSFFEQKEHLRLPGFSLIPQNDASLLLINSGMAPMKTWFTGQEEPPRKRICTCQKCIRTIDIDNVGKTSRHGTYFEMLGNFSFGDYFKHDAIIWCWEFLTQTLGIDPDLLYPSVFHDDEEAYSIWRDAVGIAPQRIVRLGREDNFWDHGSGPCGPCSEVYFDRGQKHSCGKPDCSPGCDCDRYVEVWNNVFTQFNNDGNGNYTELTQKNIDTGLGLERLACVCQGVDSIFEIDTIKSITDTVSSLCNITYGKDAQADVSMRIITDHSRAGTMLISDGVLPSNEGRGYVLRRLLRRAARHGRLLGITDLFLSSVCDTVIDVNKDAYPGLNEKAGYIKRVINTEEEAFAKTLDAGMSMLGGFIEKHKASGETVLPGADTFKLYDTFGFPYELTVDILAEHGLTVDLEGFNRMMQQQRARAREARRSLGDLAWEKVEPGLGSTPTQFLGYDQCSSPATVLAVVSKSSQNAAGETCSSLQQGEEGYIILDKTPFYAEMGGQSADYGTITVTGSASSQNTQAVFDVTDVKPGKADMYMHFGKMRCGSVSIGDIADARIDTGRRRAIMRAHSATHLLHMALRNVLGEHVNQAGSLVEPDKLRFDFTHFAAMTTDELSAVERLVNDEILANHSVTTATMPVEEAKKLGATALFGEKYGSTVRVVTMGDSVELCGGTHLECTSAAGLFAITAEFSVASNVRRIEGVTGYASLDSLISSRKHLADAAALLKANSPGEIAGKIEQNLNLIRDMRSKLESSQAQQSGTAARQMLADARDVCGLKVITSDASADDAAIDSLRQLTDTLRNLDASVVCVFTLCKDEKLTILAACGKSSIDKGIKAGELIREIVKVCGGSGGGKPDFAMGGGKDTAKVKQTLDAVDTYIKGKLQ